MGIHQFSLFPNVQFIYELHLARLEIQSLCQYACLNEDYRSFRVESHPSIEPAMRRSAYIGAVDGEPTDYFRLTRRNVTRAFNQYMTHWFYPYKGKYHPQMVRGLANIMGLKPGDSLLDPFCGSGTTPLEGALLGLRTIGFDVSPLCILISKVKTNAVHHIHKIEKKNPDSIIQEAHPLTWDKGIIDILSDPVRSFEMLARMISKSDEARRGKNFKRSLIENRRNMLTSIRMIKEGCDELGLALLPSQLEIADARKLPIDAASIDGIITSPPYSIALNYVENDAHALKDLGYDLERIKEEFIGVRGSGKSRFELYEEDMGKAYAEMARVIKPEGKVAIIIGNITHQGKELNTVENAIIHCSRNGFRLLTKIEKVIFGLYNIMQREWILIFQRSNKTNNPI